MGDRSQIAIKQDGKNRVYLYGHWLGNPTEVLRSALIRGKGRWTDTEYLTRIIFCEMVKGHEMDETGFGIGTEKHGDIEHPIPVLDCDKQTISWELTDNPAGSMTFAEFCKQP